MTDQQDPYKEIRPYRDDEVADVLVNILHNDEFLTAVTKYQFPKMAPSIGWLLKPFVRIALAAKVGEVDSVYDFQMLVANYMKKMIARTTTKLTCSGIDELDPEESYLFVSNHRDIAMDPAFVNWVRHQFGMDTVRIAIGDNLLRKPYVSDLMRLNKSFIVNRSATGREMMKALTQLSSYIDHSIVEGHSIWLAQREGRAKDGNDATDPAILKMLYMAHRKSRSFAEQSKRLNIVPVSISYELDPCDGLKAAELLKKAAGEEYVKAKGEDEYNMGLGIRGQKGNVHLEFGTTINEKIKEFSHIKNRNELLKNIAGVIDKEIYQNYHLWNSNYVAYDLLHNSSKYVEKYDEGGKDMFQSYMNEKLGELSENTEAQKMFLLMYANPVINSEAVLETI